MNQNPSSAIVHRVYQLTVRILLLFLITFGHAQAQTTINTAAAPLTNGNGSGTVTFNFRNNNAFPILITAIEGIVSTTGTSNADFWFKTTPVSGPPGQISTANGWTLAATGTFNGTANTSTLATEPFLSGLSVQIPAGVTYGFAISAYSGTSGRQRYATMTAGQPLLQFSGGGVDIIMGDLISYAGGAPPTAPANTPRGWLGKITFQPFGPCTNPPVPGTVASTANPACPNTDFILNINGGTGGTGQTFQWESSSDNITYTPIAGATLSQLTTSQLTSTYYRCQITCGTTVATAPLLVVTTASPLSGNYTINSAQATGGTNFQSFTELSDALSCAGVSGPVVVNVDPSSGPYTEQPVFGVIPGSSAINTVTINGNGETLTSPGTTTNLQTLRMNGADFMTWNNMVISTTGATTGIAMLVSNSSDNNNYNNCTFNASLTATASTNAAVAFSATTTSSIAQGNNGNNNIFTGCTMTGGYYNVSHYGLSTTNITGNQFIDCNFREAYFYGLISLYSTGLVVKGCVIERPTRATVTTTYGIYLSTGCLSSQIENNRVRNMFGGNTTSTSTIYCLGAAAAATPGAENRFINNIVSNINGNGTTYGFYFAAAAHVQIYHNTVSLDNTSSTSTSVTYGIYSTTGTGVDIKNNIVTISRGGTGTKYCLYFTGGAQVCNDNVLYMNAAAGTNNIGYFSAAIPTFAGWQAANGGIWDQQSVNADPQYADVFAGDFTPSNTLVNNIGVNVGVPLDIFGNSRDPLNPDPGAIEFSIAGLDASINWVSPVSPVPAGIQTITVNISNPQTTPINSIELNYTDGVNTVTETFTGLNILPSANQNLSFSTNYTLSTGVTITAYISQVNGGPSFTTNNDTVSYALCLALAGAYTIDPSQPEGGSNFQSFASFVSSLSCGISGPVVVNVAPGSGPYVEQISIPAITGSSATNTVTINGNNCTLTFPSGSAYHTLRLNGADHTVWNDLNVVTTGSANGFALLISGGSDNNSFSNCSFTASTTLTSTASAAVAFSSSTTSATGAGLNGNDNTFTGCTMTGGYYGVSIYGASGTPILNNKLIGCLVREYYLYGVYSLYSTGTLVSGCTFERPTRSVLSTFYGAYFSTGTKAVTFEKNRVRRPFTALPTATSGAYGLYILSASDPGFSHNVSNNLISDFDGQGAHYGLYFSGANHLNVYHNTIAFDQPASTGTGVTYGIYNTGTIGVNIRNNNITLNRGGTGAKYLLYYTGVPTISNNNNLFNTATTGTFGIGFFGTAQTTLAAWQTVNNGAFDQQSTSIDPSYLDPSTGDYQPTVLALNNTGAALGVTDDINGEARNTTTPDVGAFEFEIANEDIGVFALVNPPPTASGICYTSTESITVRIRNYGLNTIDFATNPGTVSCTVSGAGSAVLSAPLAGTLSPGATMDVVLNGTFDMSANGVYTFNAITSMTGDGNVANDDMAPVTRTRSPLVVPTLSASIGTFCVTGSSLLSFSGPVSGNIQWQKSETGTSGPWTNVGTGTPTFSTDSITVTTYYRAVLSCDSELDSSNVVTIEITSPQITSVTNGSNCGPGAVTLSATTSAFDINWYSTPTGNSLIATGNSYTTPVISNTTTYYAAAVTPGTSQISNHGLPTVFTTTQNAGVIFNLNVAVTLNSIDVYANAQGNVTVTLQNSAFNVLYTSTPVPVSALGLGAPQTITLGWPIPAGNGYRILVSNTGSSTGYHTGAFPINLGNNVGQVVNGATSTGTSTLNYFVYNMNTSTNCVGVRVPVVAAISNAPSIEAVSGSPAVCGGNSTTLSVSSTNDPNYQYTWSSIPSGYNATGSGPFTITPTSTTTYLVSAIDNSTGTFAGCVAFDTVTVVSVPALLAGTVSADDTIHCFSGASVLTTTGQAGAVQWQESSAGAGGPWTNVGVVNSDTYQTGTITQTRYYRAVYSCDAQSVTSDVVTVVVSDPQLSGTIGATRCGPGTLTLTATPDPQSTVNWYTQATGGSQVGTGSSFTTPFIGSTTTYYAEAFTGDVPVSGGRLSVLTSGGVLSASPRGVIFNANEALTIDSVGFMCTGAASTVTVQLYNSSGTATVGSPVAISIPANSGTSGAPVLLTFPAGLEVPAAGTYRIFVTSVVPTGNVLYYEFSGVTGYPYNVGNKLSITSSVTSLTGTASLTTYYYFYKLVVGSGCVNPVRLPVLAEVTPSPAIQISAGDTVLCQGESTTLSASGSTGSYSTYAWFPATGLSDDSGAVVTASPSVTTKYYLLASGNINDCQAVDSVTITVNTFSLSISANKQALCTPTDSVQVSTTVSAGSYSYLWSPSQGVDNDTLPNVKIRPPGSSGTYTLSVTNLANQCVQSRSFTVYNSTPAILTTGSDTVCGTDQVTLTASSSPGSQISWWSAATGGTRLATGAQFSPTIGSTTAYYVEARDTFALDPVSTGFTGGIIATDPNAAGNMFDVTAINDLRITGFDVHLNNDTLAPSDIAVYYKAGSYSGFTTNPSAWTLAGTANGVVSAGIGVPTPLPLDLDVLILSGQTYAFYIVVTNLGVSNSLLYNSSATSPAEFASASSDFNLQVRTGTVIFGPFTGQVASPFNRKWNGNVRYTIGCASVRDTIEAVSLSAPAISAIAVDDSICSGNSTTLQVSSPNDPNYDYVWTPGNLNGSSIQVSPSSPSSYIVTATDNVSGCITLDTVQVFVNPLPTVDATTSQAVICPGDSVQLNAAATGGLPQNVVVTTPLTVGNSSSATGFDITNTSVYPITIDQIAFTSSASAGTIINESVYYNTTPMNCVFPTNVTTAPGWTLIGSAACTSAGAAPNLTVIPLNLNITIPPGATYAFAFGGASVAYSNGTSGCPIMVSDANIAIKEGFGGTLTSTIANRRFNGSVTYSFAGTTGLVYNWTPTTGLSDPNIANPKASPSVSTIYTVTVTNSNTGCSAFDTVSVGFLEAPQPRITTPDTTLCNPAQIYIKVADIGAFTTGYPSGTTFTWKDATGATYFSATDVDSISSTSGSSFYVSVTLPGGCSGISDTSFVLTKAVAVLSNSSGTSCAGSDGSIDVEVVANAFNGVIPPYNYIWSTDAAQTNIIKNVTKTATQDTLSGLAAGTYYLQVYDAAGTAASCNSGVIAYTISSPPPIVLTLTGTDVLCNGAGDGTATAGWTGGTAPYQVLWSTGDNSSISTPGSALSGLSGGTYSITVTDAAGCVGTGTVTVAEPTAVVASFSSTQASSSTSTDGTATVSVTGGTAPYTYQWYDSGVIELIGETGAVLDSVLPDLYYCLVLDANGCLTADPFGDSVRIGFVSVASLQVRMLMEGFYAGQGQMVPVLLNTGEGLSATEVDTVRIELRDGSSYSTVYSSTAVLDLSGEATITVPGGLIGSSAYIAVFHRNTVQTWSALPVSIGAITVYDFTTSAGQAYGSNQINLGGGYYGFYSGDVNQDEVVDVLDQIDVDNDATNLGGGYVSTDVNGDGTVEILDQIILDNNATNFAGAFYPPN